MYYSILTGVPSSSSWRCSSRGSVLRKVCYYEIKCYEVDKFREKKKISQKMKKRLHSQKLSNDQYHINTIVIPYIDIDQVFIISIVISQMIPKDSTLSGDKRCSDDVTICVSHRWSSCSRRSSQNIIQLLQNRIFTLFGK